MNGDIIGAEEAYSTCIKHHPNHGMAAHLLAAMTGKTTDRAPDDYVRDLFDDYADSFEQDLINDLNYVVPQLIRKELEMFCAKNNSHSHQLFDYALDLGCGTGLVSLAVKNLVRRIDGVDLSEKMISIAQKKKRYTNIYLNEMSEFLNDKTTSQIQYDLILSGDSMVYVGDLGSIFKGIAARSQPGVVVCFTLENLKSGTFKLCQTGRYAHSKQYIYQLAKDVGLKILTAKSIVPRMDASNDIDGRLYLVTKSDN